MLQLPDRLEAVAALKEDCITDRCNISTMFWNMIIGRSSAGSKPGLHFRSFWAAWRTKSRIRTIHMIR
jgi:hypothetical protein